MPPGVDRSDSARTREKPERSLPNRGGLAFDLSLIETQLRRQFGKEQLELAESAMERSDWVKALEILVELLKLDSEHVRGLSMLREVQQILRRQHRAELAARLKQQAGEALQKRL